MVNPVRRLRSEPTADARFGARTIAAALAFVLVAAPFTVLLLMVRSEWAPLHRIDTAASGGLHRYAVNHPSFVTAMKVISDAGSSLAWTAIFLVVAGWLFWRRRPRLAIFVIVTMVTSSLINNLVKAAVDRARPVLPDPVAVARGFSFPSGHSQSAVVGYSLLVLIFLPLLHRRWLRIGAVTAAIVLTLAIGFSRVALGVHFVSDVLAGFVLGAAWVAAMTAVFNIWRADLGLRPVSASGSQAPATDFDAGTPGPAPATGSRADQPGASP